MVAGRRKYAALLSDPVMRQLLASDALAFFGVWMTSLVVLTSVYATTHSSLAQGIVVASQFGPALLVMPFAGHLLDRFNPVFFLIACRAICGAITLLLFVVGSSMPVAVVLGLNVIFSTVFGLSVMATGVLLPLTMAEKNLVRGNIILRIVPNAMMMAGGLFLVADGAAFGLYGELLLATLAFLASAVLLVPASVYCSDTRVIAKERSGVTRSFLDSFGYLIRERTLLKRFLVRMGVFVCSGGVIVMAIIAETEFGHVINAVGLFFAARGLGMIAGSLGILPFLNSGRKSENMALVAGLCIFGVAFAVAAWSVQFGLTVAAIFFAIAYAGEGIAKPVSLTLIQRGIEPAHLGRVMAMEQGLSAFVQASLTMLIAVILIEPSSQGVMVIAIALATLVLLVALATLFVGRDRENRPIAVPTPSGGRLSKKEADHALSQ